MCIRDRRGRAHGGTWGGRVEGLVGRHTMSSANCAFVSSASSSASALPTPTDSARRTAGWWAISGRTSAVGLHDALMSMRVSCGLS
eukprot:1798035-Prymnesium_polylepis.1